MSRVNLPGIRSRLLAGYGSIVLLVAVSWAVAAFSTSRLESAYSASEHVDDALLTNVMQRMKLWDDEETGIRGFLLTQERQFLQPYVAARLQVPALDLQGARLAHRAGPPVEGLEADMTSAGRQWQQWAAAVLKSKPKGSTLDARMRYGKTLFDRYRRESGEVESALATHRQNDLSRSDRLVEAMNLLLATVFAGALLLLLFVAALTTRVVTGPLRLLERDADRMRRGDLHRPVTVTGVQEFRVLGQTLDQLRIERRRTEEALRESEEVFRATFEQAPVGIAHTDLQGHWLLINRRLLDMYGYAEEELFKLRWQDITHPDDVDSDLSQLQRLIAGEISQYSLEKRFIRRDGSIFWAELTVSLARDEAGQPRYAIAVLEDIGGRKRAEEAVRESEARFRAIFERAAIGINLSDEQGKLLEVNPAFAEMLGYGQDELRCVSFAQITHPDDLEADAALFEQLIARQRDSYRIEKRYLHKDGEPCWVRLTVSAISGDDGTPRYSIGMAEDITERKRAEEALRESEERFRAIFERSALGINVTDRTGRYVAVNPAFAALLGYERSELLGKHFEEITLAEDLPADQAQYDRLLRGEIDSYQTEKRYLTKDGRPRWTRLTVSPLTSRAAERDLTIGMVEDVEERKLQTEAIQKLNAELEQRVAERTAQLASANHELEAFAYSVSHDLRAPLRSISGFSQALKEDYGEALEDQGREYTDIIVESCRDMGQLIDDLLRLSRVTRAEMEPGPVDLSAMARCLAEQLRQAEPNRCVDLRVQEGLMAWGDERLLQVALQNLLANAWKFTRDTPHPYVEVGREEGPGQPTFFVRDNGAGFDMTYADKLFGAFQRLHAASEFEGTGVGLATVQRIIRRHGGTVWAEGSVGRGATFRFTLDEPPATSIGTRYERRDSAG